MIGSISRTNFSEQLLDIFFIFEKSRYAFYHQTKGIRLRGKYLAESKYEDDTYGKKSLESEN